LFLAAKATDCLCTTTHRFWRRKPPIVYALPLTVFGGESHRFSLEPSRHSIKSTETGRCEAGTKSAAKEKTTDKTSTSPGSDAHDRLRVETHSAINRSIPRIECKSIDTIGDLLSYRRVRGNDRRPVSTSRFGQKSVTSPLRVLVRGSIPASNRFLGTRRSDAYPRFVYRG
jgi:hypothetical protein